MALSEHATLGHIYNFLTNKPDELQKAAKFERLTQLLTVGLVVGAMLLAELTAFPKLICVLLGTIGGVVLSVPWYIHLMHSGLSHLSPYIDEQRIKSRLEITSQ